MPSNAQPDGGDSANLEAPTDVIPRSQVSTDDIPDGQIPMARTEETDSPSVAQANTVIRGSSRVDRASNALRQTPAVVAKVLLGQQLNQFLIEDLIGGGGMGAVFRATTNSLIER